MGTVLIGSTLFLSTQFFFGIFAKKYLETQLIRFKGNIAQTSTFVGMDRSALHRKIKELDIKTEK